MQWVAPRAGPGVSRVALRGRRNLRVLFRGTKGVVQRWSYVHLRLASARPSVLQVGSKLLDIERHSFPPSHSHHHNSVVATMIQPQPRRCSPAAVSLTPLPRNRLPPPIGQAYQAGPASRSGTIAAAQMYGWHNNDVPQPQVLPRRSRCGVR
jgi:hypothetical protein